MFRIAIKRKGPELVAPSPGSPRVLAHDEVVVARAPAVGPLRGDHARGGCSIFGKSSAFATPAGASCTSAPTAIMDISTARQSAA